MIAKRVNPNKVIEFGAKLDTAVFLLAFALNDTCFIQKDTSRKAVNLYSLFLLPGKGLKVFPNIKRLGWESNAISWAKCCVTFTNCRLDRPEMKETIPVCYFISETLRFPALINRLWLDKES
jgi:hypothetical protein